MSLFAKEMSKYLKKIIHIYRHKILKSSESEHFSGHFNSSNSILNFQFMEILNRVPNTVTTKFVPNKNELFQSIMLNMFVLIILNVTNSMHTRVGASGFNLSSTCICMSGQPALLQCRFLNVGSQLSNAGPLACNCPDVTQV